MSSLANGETEGHGGVFKSVAGASQRPEGVRDRPPIANGPKAPTVDGAQGTKGKRNRRRKNKGVAMSPEQGPRATEPGSRGVASVGASQPRDKIQNSRQHVDQTLVTGPPLRAILGNKKPCFAWRDGNCPRGDRCRYSHDPKIRDAASEQKALREAEEREKRERLLTEERERREAEQRERERIEREERERQARERQEAERKEREKIERIAREEQARRERERQEAIERKKREEAEARERSRIEQERKRREKEEREAREREAREREQRERRRREAAATIQLVVGGSNLVTFGAGFETRSIIAGFDLCAVVVRNLTADTKKDQVARLFMEELQLDPLTFCVSEMKYDNGGQKAVVLTRVEDSEAIETEVLQGIEWRGRLLEFEMGANALWGKMNASGSNQDLNTLSIFWTVPSTTMIATYTSMEEAQRMARRLDGRMLGGRRIKAAMNERPNGPAARYYVPSSVKVTNLPPHTATHELWEIAETTSIREVKGPVYDLDSFKGTLEAGLKRHDMIRGSFQVTIDGTRVISKVRFPSHETAKRAFAAIEAGQFRFGQNPRLRPVLPQSHEYTISIIRAQYDAQRKLWDEIAEGSRGRDGAFVRINEGRHGRMFIKVLGSNEKEVGALKVRVESLVAGERLGAEYWHSSFLSNQGASFLSRVKTDTGAFVSVDRKVHALRLFGMNEAKAAARAIIEEEVERLGFLEWSIPLQRQSVSFFVRVGLKTLQDALGEDNVSLDLTSTPNRIKIKGGDDARHHLQKLMEEALASVRDGKVVVQRTGDGETCPICYDEVSSPDVLSCGHSYCEACLRHYLISAADSKKFPLVCMGEEATCGKPIAIPIIQRYLTPQRFNRLVDVVFLTYLEQNPRSFKFCTTPDCTQIYQCDNGKATHQCPSCFSKICGQCHEESHDGMSCEQARVHRNPEEQERLNNEWAARNNVKKCPECSRMIMKAEGCNHMTCPCGAHICWRCMGVFDHHEIYTHMHSAHGGIHGDEPAAPPPPPLQPQPIPPLRPFGAQPQAPQADAARRVQEEADRRYAERLRQAEMDALWRRIEMDRRLREQAEQARQILRRRREEQAEELRRRAEAAVAFERAQQRAREEQARRQKENEGGWCTIM
ncbi:RING finger protein [Coprinopsis cinerea okayama7|uniref:RBR-type E3 ubiquitin transferase n=1 Tax=Coprinopsis cinerea (strain Okayama-7 / 130 / ATCC MYA-4618 / FGSC 9003) TaxID=240176 RepID=A8N8A8_COPC7|nr:RING finger protein [Coprinopsis cinerea okayama7\|eukprot:XP_001831064.2 RING finger protein [Coprinopsis cinerea okayama7\